MKETFHKITAKRRVTGVCTKCGNKRSRTLTAYQTVNPFNKDSEGKVKTRDEISREVWTEVKAKAAEPFVCASCAKD
jgi:ribosomal protein L37AE/L43A